MIGIFYSWVFFVFAGLLGSGFGFYRGRPGLALGVAMAIAVVSATWLTHNIAGVGVDARIALSVILLIAFCLHGAGRFRFPWLWLDTVVGSIFLVGVVSDWRFAGLTLDVPVHVYGELVLPYFSGRFVAMRLDVARSSAIWFVGAGFVISLGALFESFFGINLWELFFEPKDDLVSHGRAVRYGLLYRATGPTRHSIFLGVVLLLLVPWCISLISRTDLKWSKCFGWIGLAIIIAGVFSTVSRGPLLGLMIAGLVATAIAWPWTFKWFSGASIVGLSLVLVYWDQSVAFIESTESNRPQVQSRVIEVDGESETYTGTRNRLWVWEIYSPLVVKAGPLGFGTEAVSSFPPNIPGLPPSTRTRQVLGIVDNSYLLIGLRYGWTGLGLFVSLLGGAIVTAIQLRRSAGMILYPDGPAFLTALASILAGVAFVLLTVFSSYDFMFWILFHCGVVAGLASLRISLLRRDYEGQP